MTQRIDINSIDPLLNKNSWVWENLLEKDEGSIELKVLHHTDTNGDDRPLLIWVHPGDACESDHVNSKTRRRALELEGLMAQEVWDRRETHRIIVLHRESSIFAFAPWIYDRVHEQYSWAMGQTLADGNTQLWGDDLDEAAKWIHDHRDQATAVFLTGAWRHPEWGCVTAVGKALQDAGMNVEVSQHSPSEPGVVRGGWTPESAPKQRLKLKIS